MSKLDDIRAELVAAHDVWLVRLMEAKEQLALIDAKLEVLDLVSPRTGGTTPEGAPERAPRRNLAELVLSALTDKPQTVSEIVTATNIFPSRVEATLARLSGHRLARVNDELSWSRVPERRSE